MYQNLLKVQALNYGKAIDMGMRILTVFSSMELRRALGLFGEIIDEQRERRTRARKRLVDSLNIGKCQPMSHLPCPHPSSSRILLGSLLS